LCRAANHHGNVLAGAAERWNILAPEENAGEDVFLGAHEELPAVPGGDVIL